MTLDPMGYYTKGLNANIQMTNDENFGVQGGNLPGPPNQTLHYDSFTSYCACLAPCLVFGYCPLYEFVERLINTVPEV